MVEWIVKKILVITVFVVFSFGVFAKNDKEEPIHNNVNLKKRKNLAYLAKDISSLKSSDFSYNRRGVIDVHEHVLDEKQAVRLLNVMNETGISRTCLVSSSKFTFTLNPKHGFVRYKENNNALLDIKEKYPKRFCVFVTIDPLDTNNLNLLKNYIKQGANGLKLYLGHGGKTGSGPFHSMSLNDPRMFPIYAYAQENKIPIIMHVNLTKYYEEFRNMMDLFPQLRINVPHFGLHKNTAARLKKLAVLFDKYPNLYSDISFGWYSYHISGFEALAKWRTRSRKFLTKYADRFMFATDMVLEPTKDEGYIEDTIRSYMQLLETKYFRFFYEPDFPMHGLDLDNSVLVKIYRLNAVKFLSSTL